ncbi:MAG: site-specific DNA-methyltransferase [Proteobacteria bacterium]|nr:site-specific DNA-methyltransferase [Pseudomonadota bacterium]
MDTPEVRFVELMSELFQLKEAEELDFGIYRVIRRHNNKVKEFLGEVTDNGSGPLLKGGELSEILEVSFTKIHGDDTHDKRLRLDKLGKDLGIKPGYSPEQIEESLKSTERIPVTQELAEQYRSARQELADTATAEFDRQEVLNRLYEFFSRHYQDGDFIVQRRYSKNGARWLRSTGDDTEFHWATEDMYYIKSGDTFTDYLIRLSNGKQLAIAIDPDTLNDTRASLKPQDKAGYKLKNIEDSDGIIKVVLEYLRGAQTKQRLEEITRGVAKKAGVGDDEIQRHLKRYAVRNQSDFFIHKRLREALEDDLDIFLKIDVLNTEQLLAAEAGNIASRAMRVARAIRIIGRRIIAFLGVLEDFQKRLWEKKKLVLDTRYVITLNRIEKLAGREFLDSILPEIVGNAAQVLEWQELGLGDYPEVKATLSADNRPLSLPIDTMHFDNHFKWRLLEAVTKDIGLDAAIDGTAIRSDNWQALNTVGDKYREGVKCVYIDPPYNTNASGIPYKNGYRHASWAALMHNRVDKLHKLLSNNGALFVSIDKVERTPLEHLLDTIFGNSNRIEELIWVQNTNDGKSPTYSTNHEYVEVYAKQRMYVEQDRAMFREPKPGFMEVTELVERLNPTFPAITEIELELKVLHDQHRKDYREEVEAQSLDWEEEKRNDPWKGLYPYSNAEYRDTDGCYVPESDAKFRNAKIWVWRESDWTIMSSEGKQSDTIRDSNHPNFRFYQPMHPITGKPCTMSTRGWKGTRFIDPEHPDRNSLESLMNDHRIVFGPHEKKVPQHKRMLHEVGTNVSKSVFVDYSDGEKQTTAMFGKTGLFLAPKHTRFVERFIIQTTGDNDLVVDCFGGSGSTAHAVIETNMQGTGRRRFLTVETNAYFETLIIPRLKKAGAALVWKAGKAQAINGPGLFMRVQRLEQYDETLENLGLMEGETPNLFTHEQALAYQLDAEARQVFLNQAKFTAPFGYTLKRIEGPDAVDREADLAESLVYLLGLHVERMYRDGGSVVITGITNLRREKVAVLWRDTAQHEQEWLQTKMAEHQADCYFSNDLATISFNGAEKFRSIEQLFCERMTGGE